MLQSTRVSTNAAEATSTIAAQSARRENRSLPSSGYDFGDGQGQVYRERRTPTMTTSVGPYGIVRSTARVASAAVPPARVPQAAADEPTMFMPGNGAMRKLDTPVGKVPPGFQRGIPSQAQRQITSGPSIERVGGRVVSVQRSGAHVRQNVLSGDRDDEITAALNRSGGPAITASNEYAPDDRLRMRGNEKTPGGFVCLGAGEATTPSIDCIRVDMVSRALRAAGVDFDSSSPATAGRNLARALDFWLDANGFAAGSGSYTMTGAPATEICFRGGWAGAVPDRLTALLSAPAGGGGAEGGSSSTQQARVPVPATVAPVASSGLNPAAMAVGAAAVVAGFWFFTRK